MFVFVVPIGCGGTDTETTDGGPNDRLDGNNPDGGVDGGVTDGGNPDGGLTDGGVTDGGADAGPDADSDWEFALAVLNGRKWEHWKKDSTTPFETGTFALDVFPNLGCSSGKRLTVWYSLTVRDEFCFEPDTMHYSWRRDANYYIEGDFTFCHDCAGYTGTVKEVCLRHRHISGYCHPDWSDQLFVDGPWVLIVINFSDGSTRKLTYTKGD